MTRKVYLNGALYYVQTDIAGPASRHTSLRRAHGVAVQIWTYAPTPESATHAQFPSRYQYAITNH
jgi:hypothetical protein